MRMSYLACLTSCLMVLAPGAAWSKFPDAVNDQITDSVAQTDTQVEGEVPALSADSLQEATTGTMNSAGEAAN